MTACLVEDSVLRFVRAEVSEDERRQLEQHAAACAPCLDLLAAAAAALLSVEPEDAAEAAAQGAALASYQILEPLGSGGVGIVYRARRVATGEVVALKTVRVRAGAAVSSIRREIHALSRLRHPGVVRVFEQGVEDGRPWYAMELVDGRTLESYLDELDTAPWPGGLEQAVDTIRRLAETLAFLHGRGLVHRDLSSRNVLVRPDGTPVLADFGLALQGQTGARDVLGELAAVGGTVAFMAPEQIRGERVDARADLYALGVILYRVLAGRLPFSGTLGAVIAGHLTRAPRPPSTWVPGVPPRLERLALRLLAKHPRDRIGYAEDVAAELGGGLGGTSGAVAYTYRPSLFGQHASLDVFDELIARCGEGAGGRVFVAGGSGMGKTRLLAEVTARARKEGLAVVAGECAPLGLGPGEDAEGLHPFRPLLQAVADACLEGDRQRRARLLGPRRKVLAAFEPGLYHLPDPEPYPDPPPLRGDSGRARVLAHLRETLAAFAAERRLLLVLDDLQWADELSLAFLASLPAGFCELHGVLLVVAYRVDEGGEGIERLAREPGARRLSLPGLRPAELSGMVAEMLAQPEAPAALLDPFVEASEGSPFFLVEYVRTAIAEGWLRRAPAGGWRLADEGLAPLPRSHRDLVDRRLATLSAPARALLGVAAALGRDHDSALLCAVAEAPEEEVLTAVQELVVRCLLEDGGDDRLRFAHDRLREGAYAALSGERRRDLHRRAAAAVERRLKGTPGDALLYPVLAHHWVHAGARGKAFEYLEKAGERALATAAGGEAARLFERALALAGEPGEPPPPGAVARWQRLLGEAWFSLGDLPRCEASSREALEAYGFPLPTTRAGWVSALLGQAARQAAHVALPWSVRPRARSPEARAALAEAAQAAARVAYPYLFAEDGPALVTTCLLAVNLAERAGAIQAAARSYGQLGYLAGVFHARPLAARYFARARASAAAARDPGELAIARYHEAIYHLCDGAWAEAHAAGEGALAALSDLRSPNEAEIVETILAHVDYGAGRYDDSIARCDRILESARERANEQHAAWGHYTGARSLLRRGRVGEAIGKLESARVLLRAQADQASEIICTGLSALAFQRAGDLHAAERAADACLSRIGAGLPTVWSVGDGYAGAAEAYLDLWAATARAPQDPSLAARLRRAWAAQLRFAVVFGIGRPAFWITTGRVLGLGGARRAARWALSRALQESEVRAMPYEAAVASLRLAALGPVGSPERARDLDRAHRGFTALGCAHELGAVERAAQERR